MSCEIERFLCDCSDRTANNLNLIYQRQQNSNKLIEVIRYASLDGGKGIRPGFVYAVAEFCESPLEKADDIACAVELIHSYSLIHDDLPSMDNDDFRRGKASTHKKFGEARAILAGDAMHSMAFETLAKSKSLDTTQKVELIRLLAKAAGIDGMCGGQTLDIMLAGKATDLATVETLHRMKTGLLIKACIQMSTLCGSRKTWELPAFRTFADNIGLCFQISDDIIDLESDLSANSGGKLTYPSVLGVEKAQEELLKQRDLCFHCLEQLNMDTRKLELLTQYISERQH